MTHALTQHERRQPGCFREKCARLLINNRPGTIIGPCSILPGQGLPLTRIREWAKRSIVAQLREQLLASGNLRNLCQHPGIHKAVDHIRPGLTRPAARLRSADKVACRVGSGKPGVVVHFLRRVADRRREASVSKHAAMPNDLHHLLQILGVKAKVLEEPCNSSVAVNAASCQISHEPVVGCMRIEE